MPYIKLHLTMREDKVYPPGIVMSDFDRLLDVIIEMYPTGEWNFAQLSEKMVVRWGWDTLFGKQQALDQFAKFIDGQSQFLKREEEFLVLETAEEWYDTKLDRPEQLRAQAQKIVDLFNLITGRKVTLNPPRERSLLRRLKEGAKMKPKPIGLPQFEAVFKHKYKEWSEDPAMSKYIDIETLCGDKFYKYLDQAREAFKAEQKKATKPTIFRVIAKPSGKEVWIDTKDDVFTRKLIESGHYIVVDKYDLIELADRRARDYAKERNFTLTPLNDGTTQHSNEKQTVGGPTNGPGHIGEPGQAAPAGT